METLQKHFPYGELSPKDKFVLIFKMLKSIIFVDKICDYRKTYRSLERDSGEIPGNSDDFEFLPSIPQCNTVINGLEEVTYLSPNSNIALSEGPWILSSSR